MQAFAEPLIARSTDRVAKHSQRPGLSNQKNFPFMPADESNNLPEPIHPGRQKPVFVHSPFQTALLVMAASQRPVNSGRAAYVCYLSGQQVLGVERLHCLRGHNPAVNLTTVISRARRDKTITGVIVATWVHSTSEYPYAEEFADEVHSQYDALEEAGIKMVDNLRLSETGVYSYYGDHRGPYCDAPTYHEKSICRLY